MKKNMETYKFRTKKTYQPGIAHNDKLIETAERLGLDSRSISIEVRRNRVPVDYTKEYISKCPNFNRWSLVCTKCKLRYSKNCCHKKFKYDARTVQRKADANLINLRKGIDLDSEEFKKLDSIIKRGIEENKSIYQIKIENNDIIDKSITTLYRYVNKDYLSTKRIDLPYAVKLKKRKYNKKYDYSNNNIDRSNHTYLDYLSYMHKNPNCNVWQLDFLGTIKSDSKSILLFILPNVHFTLIDIIKKPNSQKVVNFFDQLEEKIGTENFIELTPVILTDRAPCFTDIEGICFSKITGEERCKLFFCDPYVSN